jgi:hypothetical protein
MDVVGKIEQYARITQNLVIILGVFGGIISLVVVQFDKRVARTLDLYKDYAAAVRKDFVELDFRWAQFAKEQPQVLDKNQEEQRRLVSTFFANVDNERALANILNYYDTVYVCIINRACDRDSAIELFGLTAKPAFEISAHYTIHAFQT